jgi:hypothetical protein
MNWHLVTYADKNFEEKQKFIHQIHKNGFVHHPFNREQLENTEFYQDNKEILDESTGAGWWIWKPYFILDVLKSCSVGDYILYCDCGDMFSPGLKGYVENIMSDEDFSLLLVGNNKNGNYTKRDCFIKMNCDESDYYDSNQLEAGFMIWKSSEESIKEVQEWLEFCRDPQIIKNEKSVLGEELLDFIEHRNDQSVLTNLAIRDGLSVVGHECRNYVECDYDYWYERGSNGFGREIDLFLTSIKNA